MKVLQRFSRVQRQHSSSMPNSQTSSALLSPIATPKRMLIGLAAILIAITLLFTYGANQASTAKLNSARQDSANAQTGILELKTDSSTELNATADGTGSLNNSELRTDSSSTLPDVDVTVNGRTIEVPANGHVEQTITTDSGQTDVTITQDQSSNGDVDNSSSTSTSFSISGSSHSSVDVETDTDVDVRVRERVR